MEFIEVTREKFYQEIDKVNSLFDFKSDSPFLCMVEVLEERKVFGKIEGSKYFLDLELN